jgi:hypothetical protein
LVGLETSFTLDGLFPDAPALARARLSGFAALVAVVLALSLAADGGRARAAGRIPTSVNSTLAVAAWAHADIGGLNPHVFDLALRAASCAARSGAVEDLSTLTVIDYSRPSTEKRLWVFDLRTRALRYEELVAHGSGSGENLSTSFSNVPETHQSSLGLFRTEAAYFGKNGYSLRLHGLDEGFNDRAYERAIVMHGAPYVSDDVARAQGRLGRSWGCPALRLGIVREVIDTVKGSGLIFAYYPDQRWLQSSKYLGDCAGDR